MNNTQNYIAFSNFTFGNIQSATIAIFRRQRTISFNLAENLYQNKIYAASQYEFSRQYFYNQNLENSKKETALFFSNVIGVILGQNHAEEGLDNFMKEYPKSALFAQAIYLWQIIIWLKKIFQKLWKRYKKSININSIKKKIRSIS
jgi:Zn-dependent M28 family amino/carboxypeptidase